MAKKRPGLGKGLGALIPEVEQVSESSAGVLEIPLERISPNPHQPRANFDPDGIAELAASIQEHGIIQPLIVTKSDQPGHYTLIAGERRLMAARETKLSHVPAIVREASSQDRLELALIENVQRTDLSPLETANAYQQLGNDFGLSHGEIAERVGKSRVSITNTLRLLSLPPSLKQALVAEKISEGHARALLGLPNSQSQAAALQTVVEKGLNVRQTEALVRKLTGEKPAPKPKSGPSPEVIEIEDQLQASLGTKVKLKHGKKGGTITIHYYSNEELDTLIDKLS